MMCFGETDGSYELQICVAERFSNRAWCQLSKDPNEFWDFSQSNTDRAMPNKRIVSAIMTGDELRAVGVFIACKVFAYEISVLRKVGAAACFAVP